MSHVLESFNMTGAAVMKWLLYCEQHKFSVGDYLIKKVKNHQYNRWDIEIFSGKSNDVYRKYKVLRIDDVGIPYITKIRYDGKPSQRIFPLCNVDLEYEHYELDPEYETYLLLGKENEYDPQGKWKEYSEQY